MTDQNCPTCHHPALQHLLVQIGESGVAACKICGEAAANGRGDMPRCDFKEVQAAVARVYPKTMQHLKGEHAEE